MEVYKRNALSKNSSEPVTKAGLLHYKQPPGDRYLGSFLYAQSGVSIVGSVDRALWARSRTSIELRWDVANVVIAVR